MPEEYRKPMLLGPHLCVILISFPTVDVSRLVMVPSPYAWINGGGDPMKHEFPAAVPEIPVTNMDQALDYYQHKLGFDIDWGGADGGIAGISQGQCRIFLTDADFREYHRNAPPVMIWLNLDNNQEVDELHEIWKANGARIISPPESKPWKLHEFTASDLDGNLFRVFYDFSSNL